MRKPRAHSPSRKSPGPAPGPKQKKPPSVPAFPTLAVVFESIEVRDSGWPGDAGHPTDLSLILQLEIPSAAAPNTALASARMPFRAASGQTVGADDLPPDASGRPFFGDPVRVSNHVNLHARLFVDRTNAIGPILGAALNTVIGTFVGKIPLLGSPVRDVLHIQIGNVISTELARATAIVPVDTSMKGTHAVTIALVAPRTIPGVYAPPGSPEGYRKGVVVTEGDLVALLHVSLTLALPR
ncbi:MAG: hypothetical protein ABI768_14925 [Acidobacteriota bacterium]